ncbi:uncharacterized protein LOC131428013 [Malaya genurostris]|uniref:uncharacterized protein LOC131428013 n=1 Tax=Malaya genurostris TaxID=325434 RepID=UPI0026F3FB89|nr:uncharacterized protein LOC131428013 [Malaya genurostris]
MAPAASSAAKKQSLKVLTTKLKDIQLSFNDIWQFVEDFTEDATVTEVEIRLQKLDELWERFGDVLVDIKSHDDFSDDGEGYEKERKEFSDHYYRAKSFLLDRVKERQEHSVLEQSIRIGDTTTLGTLDHVRLPQIKLQSFSGDIDEWLSFRDLFTSLIHWKSDLPEVEKFHYLKGCLQGEPKGLIEPLQITKANYLVAWEMLLKRYNNSKLLRKRQIESLFKLPSLTKESASELHVLLENFERIVQTLDQSVQSSDYKDLLLVNLLTTRLDPVTRRGWEECSSSRETDTLKDLTDFLHRRVQVLESLPSRASEARSNQHAQPHSKPKLSPVKNSYNATHASVGRCVVCSANHLLYQCGAFQRMSVTEREALLRTNSLCRNCFRHGHQARECQSKFSCRTCKGRHHTMVCFKRGKDSNDKANDKETNHGTVISTKDTPASSSSSSSSQMSTLDTANVSLANVAQSCISSQVLLATAVVVVEDDNGGHFPARALLDSGSESNFVTERMSQRLRVERQRVDISVCGIGQAATRVKQRIITKIKSRVSDFSRELSFLVLSKVTVNLPIATINPAGWAIPRNVELADPSFCVSKDVDMILGIEAFFDFFVTGRKISLGEQLPALNESVFGWVVCGGLSIQSPQINCNASSSEDLDSLVARFWDCEEIGSAVNYSPEEARCEAIFAQTVKRNSDGRYTVSLPIDEIVLARIGDSRNIAYRRLLGTERRLARDANLREQYVSFMNEYCDLGHMRKIDSNIEGTVNRCYLPHHPVVKESSTTTRLRVVFDASCKTSSGVSLNEALMVGPVIQEDLRSIILCCRTKQIMMVADVEKMFRQIYVKPEERYLQCILWRSSLTEEVATYELNTVTYGTKPAPFLATRTLQQLTIDEKERFPLAAKAVVRDTYMDDVITGSDDVDEAVKLRSQLTEMMSCGGFRLRKWASNSTKVLDGIAEDDLAIREGNGISLDPDPAVKTLGLIWNPSTDTFRFQFTIPTLEQVQTEVLSKRRILSIIATLFDPLGLIGAAITTAKLFMQILWTLRDNAGHQLHWDQPVTPILAERWRKFCSQLPLLNEIRIERRVILPDAISIEIHCFSDASEKAYGACLYIRSQDVKGRVLVRLLTSKSKVAPLKSQSIPRLELCGALLSAQLFEKVQKAIGIEATVRFWTDSTCVLRWISAVPTTWSTYIANRVAKIQNLTEGAEWRHIPGIHNPADLISRGISPRDILDNSVWWKGPSWLTEACEQWPKIPGNFTGDEGDNERRRTTIATTCSSVAEFNDWYISKFSSYSNLIRRTAILLRFMKLLRTPKEDRFIGFITTAELREAELVILRRIQLEGFAEELKVLAKGMPVSGRSALRWYNPGVAKDCLIRLGGRLNHSHESEDTKHPIALPSHHRLTRMLMKHYHERLLHAGPQLLLSVDTAIHGGIAIRQGNSVAPVLKDRSRLLRADLPETCTQTGNIHMELVSDLTTDRFLQALRRFIARRGKCTDLYSDNGTNFVGARNRIQELLSLLKGNRHCEQVTKFCLEEGIQWHFSPPSAPHFGGLWEAAVRSAKHHLLRVIGDNPVTPEDMNTLLVQIEGCLNSRPLTAASEDPRDLEPLTPAHFLVGSSLHALPEPSYQDIPINRLKQWQLMQRKLHEFWTRWRREYLSQLQGRVKRWRPPVKIEVGKLVIIKDDNQPPFRWKMGRILKLHPGDDDVVRVVTLKTTTGLLTRPVEKVCLLPIGEHDEINESTSNEKAVP